MLHQSKRVFGFSDADGKQVITVIGLIITGIVITAGGAPNHEAIGFRFWNQTGGFVQYQDIHGAKGRFLGFFSGMASESLDCSDIFQF